MMSLANKASAWFRLGVWLFAATMFADAANLDDLFTSSVILHTDEDATAQGSGFQLDSGVAFNSQGGAPLSFSTCRSVRRSHDGAITILDQDSPSLEAETTVSDQMTILVPLDEPALVLSATITESLYLKFRSLLI